MRVAPFEGSDAEHGYVQHIGFAGIDARGLLRGDFRRDEILLDGISVDAVFSTYSFTLILKLFNPAWFLIVANSP